MEHDWRELVVTIKPDDRPHLRCQVCRMICIAASDESSHMSQAKNRVGSCPGPFVAPPHKSLPYVGTVARWIRDKRPRRSAEAVLAIYTTHCKPCDRRSPENVCLVYDCRVLPSGPPECNLIAMATEKCPLGKWS